MKSFHNIMESSKINKNNKKEKNMKQYVETFENTRYKEQEKLEKMKNSIKNIEKKIDFNQDLHSNEDEFFIPDTDSKDIFFSNNLNIDSLLTNFDNLNELARIGTTEIPLTESFEDKISLQTMNLNSASNTSKFYLDTNILSDRTNNVEIENYSFLNEKSMMIKTVGNTLEEKEWKREKIIKLELNKEINLENKEKIMDTSILTKTQIINIVYKESYKNKFVSGFGDFLRGCYFILEFCRKFKMKYNFLIYHPIRQFFKNSSINREIPNSILDTVEFCEYCNINFDVNGTFNPDTSSVFHEFFKYLNKQDIYNRNLFIYTICYPTIHINNENKQIIRQMIEPISEIENNIQHILSQLKLSKKNYFIIQIRSGDDYLKKNNHSLNKEYKEKILSTIKNIIHHKKKNFLLIADNFLIKHFVIHHFPFIKTYFKEITHLGENSNLPREKIKNTLIDFYIMSYACAIFSLSTYEHGSGFSRWCSITYDIPYHCIKI